MTPLGASLAVILAMLVVALSRRGAAFAMLASACFLTEGQPLDVLGFHFTAWRFVMLAGLLRVISRGELSRVRWNKVDRIFAAYTLVIAAICVVRLGTSKELIFQLGNLYNACCYLVFRSLLREEFEGLRLLPGIALMLIPLCALLLLESFTGKNLYSAFGGVYEISWVRSGHVRAEGPFRNPITAGAFGATLALLFATALFARLRPRLPLLLGSVLSVLIVMCARSSGPFLGMILGFVAFACWPLRRHVRAIRWALVGGLVALQLIMKAPVWFLLDRVSGLVGGGGYHRAFLIDQFVNHFDRWWLIGTQHTSDWFAYRLPIYGTADLTNRFVADGVYGGLLGLGLSIWLVVRCFGRVGTALRANAGRHPTTERLAWGLGATLVGSVGILFSITYFDQMQLVWLYFLATLAGLQASPRAHPAVPNRASKPVQPPVVPTPMVYGMGR